MRFRRRPQSRPDSPYPVPPDEERTLVQGAPPRRPPPPPPGAPRRWWPPDRELWPWLALLLVLVLVGAGLAAFFASRSHHRKTAVVPAVVGLNESSARARIHSRGFRVQVDRAPSHSPAGTVIKQRPSAGTRMSVRRSVRLAISSGLQKVAVPNVITLSEADAVSELTQAGLKVHVFQVPSSKKAGQVIAQNPVARKQVPAGSNVRLNVSKGQTTTSTVTTTTATTTTATSPTTTTTRTTKTTTTVSATVPNVTAQTLSDAAVSLKAAHLLPSSYPVPSSEAGGTVVGQNPGAGTTVKSCFGCRSSLVRLTVSVGSSRPKLPVPNVSSGNQDVNAAVSTLASKFTTKIVFRTASTAAERGVVLSQLPAAGTQARRWAQVVIYVGT